MEKKTDEVLVKTLIKLKKVNPAVAKELSKPKRKLSSFNLDKISGDNVLVLGKILSSGDFKGKKVVGLSASEKAIEKIKKAGGGFVSIFDEVKKNPSLSGLEVLK